MWTRVLDDIKESLRILMCEPGIIKMNLFLRDTNDVFINI